MDADTKETIDTLRLRRPGLSINHTDWGDLDHRPLVISIETKAEAEPRRALVQMGTWHAAQWRCLRQGFNRSRAAPQIEFLAGVTVGGHDWNFVATVPNNRNGKPTVLHSLPLGSTKTLLGIYQLFASLHYLREWGETIFWPAFRHDILERVAESESSGDSGVSESSETSGD